jgi:modulator of FtsH protease
MEWNSFFQGELGAAAALAGLLFVSVSVNQTRILELGRMADRGLEALMMLLMVLVVASLPLVPGQPPHWLGAEILLVAAGSLAALIPLQRGCLRDVDRPNRSRSVLMVAVSRLAVGLAALGGLTRCGAVAWRACIWWRPPSWCPSWSPAPMHGCC